GEGAHAPRPEERTVHQRDRPHDRRAYGLAVSAATARRGRVSHGHRGAVELARAGVGTSGMGSSSNGRAGMGTSGAAGSGSTVRRRSCPVTDDLSAPATSRNAPRFGTEPGSVPSWRSGSSAACPGLARPAEVYAWCFAVVTARGSVRAPRAIPAAGKPVLPPGTQARP